MKSKTSFFNLTLLRKNTVRFSPIWIIYLLWGMISLPAGFATRMLDSGEYWSRFDVASIIGRNLEYQGPFISAALGVLLAMALWSYLFNARSVSLMHSLPVRRSGLFLTNYVSGLLFIAVPNLLIMLATLLVTAMEGVAAPAMAFTWFFGMTAMEIFFFSFATFIAMFTGHILALPVFYGIYNFICMALYGMLVEFIRPMLFGITSLSSRVEGVLEWLTPFLNLLQNLHCEQTMGMNEVLGYEVVTQVSMEGMELCAIYAAAGLALAVLSYLVYRRRNSETAGDVVTVGWAKVVFQYGTALSAAFIPGQMLYSILFSAVLPDTNYPCLIACMLVMGLAGYAIATMLLNKSFRVLRQSLRGGAVSAAVVLLVFAAAFFDVFGLVHYVPAPENVREVSVSMSDVVYSRANLREADNIRAVTELHSLLVDQKNAESAEGHWIEDVEMEKTILVTLNYSKKNGSMVSRSYHVLVDRNTAEGKQIDEKVRALLDSPEYQTSHYLSRNWLPDDKELTGGSLSYYEENEYSVYKKSISKADALALYDAVAEDGKAGRLPAIDLFSEAEHSGDYANMLNLSYAWYSDYGGRNEGELEIPLTPGMTSTIAKLRELGVTNERVQLRTYEEVEQWMPDGVDLSNGEYPEEYTTTEVPAAAGID